MQSRSQRIQKKVFAKSFCMRLLSYSILYYILHFSVHKTFFTFITSESLSVSYIIVIAARWTKSLKFTLSIAVNSDWQKIVFGLWRREKRELKKN